MASYALRRFCAPETLREVAPKFLNRFLRPHSDYLAGRRIFLPPDAEGRVDCDLLTDVFLAPDESTPRELIEALCVIDAMATREGMASLLAAAQAAGLPLDEGADPTPADVAVQVWLLDRALFERKHGELYIARPRTYETFQSACPPATPWRAPDARRLAALAAELDDWCEQRRWGRGARVIPYGREDGTWFLVWHGEPFRREDSLEGARPRSVCFRPLKHDVVVYDPRVGELRINARSKPEKQLYCRLFGKHLFGDEGRFPHESKYTLRPLREAGPASLVCTDVKGVDWVKLTEVQVLHGGRPWELVTRRSDDLFELLRVRGESLAGPGRLMRAAFQVKFAEWKRPRSVVLRPPNVAQYTRDDDEGLVEAFFQARGFIRDRRGGDDEELAEVLAGD